MKNKAFRLALGIAAIGIAALSLAACPDPAGGGGGTTPPVSDAYNIGDTGPGGGKIFYRDETGFTMTDTNQICHYLEAAPADMATTLAWASSGYTGTDITGTGTAIGTGRKNTALILAADASAPAAKACEDLTAGGKTDWFFPGKDELNQLYVNRSAVSNLGTTNNYWSSSQSYDWSAWNQNFGSGIQYNGNGSKSTNYIVRAVRAF